MNILQKLKKSKKQTTSTVSYDWQEPFAILREKWTEIPTSNLGRQSTVDLLELSDQELLAEWEHSRERTSSGPYFNIRGWYHTLYADSLRGKKLLEVGSGFGVDGITFAQRGARVTFVDLAESNLKIVQRLCSILGLKEVNFLLMEDVESLCVLDTDYDVIMAIGSLHHAPVKVIKREVQELVKHLKVGGRWLQLAYPKVRWQKDGCPPFDKWGEITDGTDTPWAEWYDLPKLLQVLEPACFKEVLYHNFHNNDFNWFDLLYEG